MQKNEIIKQMTGRIVFRRREISTGFRPDEPSKTEQTNNVRHPARIFASA
jgi:hypothetical protein